MSVTRWLTRREVAELTGFSVRTLEDWAALRGKGKGPKCFKVGNRARYPIADFETWQQAQQKTAA